MAADEAAAEHGVRLALHDEVEQVRVLLGAVLEVGVLDDDDVARRLRDPPPHRRALAPVPLLQEELEAALARPAPATISRLPSVEASSTAMSSMRSGTASTRSMISSTVARSL